MGYYEYLSGRNIAFEDPPFDAIIQAAMRKADTDNLAKLKAAWPAIWADLEMRYNLSGGLTPEEQEALHLGTS